jgi:antagonist of KipI
VPEVLGSRSTYLRGGFGGFEGRALRTGDQLPIGPVDLSGWMRLAGRSLPAQYRIRYSTQVNIPVVAGPQADVFGEAGQAVFFAQQFDVAATSDRMGYRLSGAVVPRQSRGELLSEGIAPGSVQVPLDGQPVVLMSDRPATGGYAKIATVALAGLPALAQCMPGLGQVSFHAVSVGQAQAQYRDLVAGIEKGLKSHEN